MSVTQVSARRLSLGFSYGLYSLEDVGAWVDARILESPEDISEALLSLTSLKNRHRVDISNDLRALAGEARKDVLARIELSVLLELHQRGRMTLEVISQRLPWISQPISWEVYGEAMSLQDGYEVAEDGHGNLNEAKEAVLEFLQRHGLEG